MIVAIAAASLDGVAYAREFPAGEDWVLSFDKLGTTLTEWGAEKDGNADGSIPAYAGGVEVVEATRKAGARHAYSRRTFYLDEDTWGGINMNAWVTYDLLRGNYFVINVGMGDANRFVRSDETAEGLSINLTPAQVEGSGIR
jgi:hypothetical protein